MSRSYLDKENQHILTHTKDNRVNSFIANVNELVRHVDGILYSNTIFNQDVVDVLREALETDFTELLKDLKKGNHLGNRQLDINLLKNMSKWNEYLTEEEQINIWLDKNELVYYDSALVKFIDGTTHRVIFQFDGVEGPITTHGDLLLQLNNDEEFLAKLEKTSANTFPAKVVGEYLKFYDKLGENSNVEGVELNAVRGNYKEKNPYYYWIATTSALQVLAMRSTEIIKLGDHIDKVVSLALNVDQMLELQNRLPQLVDTYDEEGNPKGDVTIYNHLTELLEIYSKLDYLLDVVNVVEAAENSANMAEQFADEALTRLNKIQSIKVERTITTTPNNEAVVFYNSDSNEFTFTIPKGEKGDRGEPFQVNASGTMEQRALYDDRPKGFSFLSIDTSEVFFRKSDTHADWTVGVPFGKGDKGDKGDKGEDGRTPELSDSIDSASSLTAASSKAVKTVNDKLSIVNDKLSIASPEMKGLVNSGGNNGELFGTVENQYKMIPRVELLASATLAGLVPTFSGNNLNLIVNDRGEMEWREANSLINATNKPTPNTIMLRDEAGRVQVETPVHDNDIVNKGYVEGLGITQFKAFTVNDTFVSPKTGLGFVLLVGGGQGGNNGQHQATALPAEVLFFPWPFTAGASYSIAIGAGGAGGAYSKDTTILGSHGGQSNFAGNISRGGGSAVDAGNWGFVAVEFGLPDVYSSGGVAASWRAAQAGMRGYGAPGGYGGFHSVSGRSEFRAGGAGAPGLCIVFY